MIELLLVIVVLGVLAATVVMSLGGTVGQSAQAACNSDAKSVEVAVQAFQSSPMNTTNSFPTTVAQLTSTAVGGPYLHQAPNNPNYLIYLGDGTSVDKLGNPTTRGEVLVGPPTNAPGINTAYDYDSAIGRFSNPCDDASIVS